MPDNGVRSTDLDTIGLVDDLIGNAGGNLCRIPIVSLRQPGLIVNRVYNDVNALVASTEARRGDGAVWDVLRGRYVENSSASSDYIEKAGGVRLSPISDVYNPVDYGLENGGDILPYLEDFCLNSEKPYFVTPSGYQFSRGAGGLVIDTNAMPGRKKLFLRAIDHITGSDQTITIKGTAKGSNVPTLQIYDTTIVMDGDFTAWNIEDVNEVQFHDYEVWGALTSAESRGTFAVVQNRDSYTERVGFFNGKSKYLKHLVRCHIAGGGYSQKGLRVQGLEVSGGVPGACIIAQTTDVEVSLGIPNAVAYQVGEIVTQANTGAAGRVIGAPQSGVVLMLSEVTGTFDTINVVEGAVSEASEVPFNVILNRHGNIYDGRFTDIIGNVNDDVRIIKLAGSMRDTRISGLSMEASTGTEAYYFEVNDADWSEETAGRPIIDIPDLGGQMALFAEPPSKKVARARPFLDGVRLYPALAELDNQEGVFGYTDGAWNPNGVSTVDGAAGYFGFMKNEWRRFMMLATAETADFYDVAKPINLSKGKHRGMFCYDTGFNAVRFAVSATDNGRWPFTATPPSGATTARPTNVVYGEQFTNSQRGVVEVNMGGPWRELAMRVPAPATSTAPGAEGQWAFDEDHLYFYVGDGTTHAWHRQALDTAW